MSSVIEIKSISKAVVLSDLTESIGHFFTEAEEKILLLSPNGRELYLEYDDSEKIIRVESSYSNISVEVWLIVEKLKEYYDGKIYLDGEVILEENSLVTKKMTLLSTLTLCVLFPIYIIFTPVLLLIMFFRLITRLLIIKYKNS